MPTIGIKRDQLFEALGRTYSMYFIKNTRFWVILMQFYNVDGVLYSRR